MRPRGAMSLANAGYNGTLTWANPNQDKLEEQALVPMFGDSRSSCLSGLDQELFARLRADARHVVRRAFPTRPTPSI
jgi:cytochrome c peroxidase